MGKKAIITMHAIRRFAERVMGVEGLSADDEAAVVELRAVHGIDTVEIERLLGDLVQRGVELGAVAVTLKGSRYVLRDRALITILDMPKRRRRQGRIDRSED